MTTQIGSRKKRRQETDKEQSEMWNKSQDRVVSRSWRGYRRRDGQEGQEQQKGPRGGGIGYSGGTLGQRMGGLGMSNLPRGRETCGCKKALCPS